METIPQPPRAKQPHQQLIARDIDALVIEELASPERRLRERVADLEADRDAYQLLAKRSIDALHDVVVERDRLRSRVHQLHEEIRQTRLPAGRVAA